MSKNYKAYSYFVLLTSIVALTFVYILELFEIHPCRLCIYQQYVYYGLICISIIILIITREEANKYAQILEWVIYCFLLSGVGIGVFQVLIEKHLINYESSCTTNISGISSPEELFSSINSKDLVACDVPQIEILNLSLSSWNVLYMICTLCVSLLIMYKKRKTKSNDRE